MRPAKWQLACAAKSVQGTTMNRRLGITGPVKTATTHAGQYRNDRRASAHHSEAAGQDPDRPAGTPPHEGGAPEAIAPRAAVARGAGRVRCRPDRTTHLAVLPQRRDQPRNVGVVVRREPGVPIAHARDPGRTRVVRARTDLGVCRGARVQARGGRALGRSDGDGERTPRARIDPGRWQCDGFDAGRRWRTLRLDGRGS